MPITRNKLDKLFEDSQVRACERIIRALFKHKDLWRPWAMPLPSINAAVSTIRGCPNSPTRIASALRRLVRDKVLRSRMSEGKRVWEANI